MLQGWELEGLDKNGPYGEEEQETPIFGWEVTAEEERGILSFEVHDEEHY